ncbi:unnamed protein product [Ceratitis capitata]|uniref:(Mediterranean fruit fly) hypothetical protein n=1 Tax=Ceratitis capitata TaxID=7213 RepID=A0A811U296_CERCA|nr:unnamed protein product [Ceratitis capitata]
MPLVLQQLQQQQSATMLKMILAMTATALGEEARLSAVGFRQDTHGRTVCGGVTYDFIAAEHALWLFILGSFVFRL